MTSNSTFPKRLTIIDDLTRPDHYYLDADDTCYFLGEYTARKSYKFSATNQLISNLKKPVSVRREYQWRYKEQAIRQAAEALRFALSDEDLNSSTFVPIPPSKAKNDSLYDDRMLRILKAIRPQPRLDIRELIIQKMSTNAIHLTEDRRPPPHDLLELYDIDGELLEPPPSNIVLFDDVITTGTHFKAAKKIIGEKFPNADILGLFIARRALDSIDMEDMFPRFFD